MNSFGPWGLRAAAQYHRFRKTEAATNLAVEGSGSCSLEWAKHWFIASFLEELPRAATPC